MRNFSILAGILLPLACAAQPPSAVFGTWKMDPQKVTLGKVKILFQAEGGKIKFTGSNGRSYMFSTDGQDYPTSIPGYTAAWKEKDKHHWEAANKFNGKTLSTTTVELAEDGNTMTLSTSGVNPNGESFHNVSVYQRASGEGGLLGSWIRNPDKSGISLASTIILEPDGSDGIKFRSVDFKEEYTAKFDGKEYPVTGPNVPPGATVSLKRVDDHTFSETTHLKGESLGESTFTASQDGKVMTETAKPPNPDAEPNVYVFNKQ